MSNADVQHLDQLDPESFTDAFFVTDEMVQLAASQITDDRFLFLPSQNKENIDPAVIESLDEEGVYGLGRMQNLDNIYKQVWTIADINDGSPRAMGNADEDEVVNEYPLNFALESEENVDHITTKAAGNVPSSSFWVIESVNTAANETVDEDTGNVQSSEGPQNLVHAIIENNEDHLSLVPNSTELLGSPVVRFTNPLDVSARVMTSLDLFDFPAAPEGFPFVHYGHSAGIADAPHGTYDGPSDMNDIAVAGRASKLEARMPETCNDDDYCASTQCRPEIVAIFAAHSVDSFGSDGELHSAVSDTLQLGSLETPPATPGSRSTVMDPAKIIDANSNGTPMRTAYSESPAFSVLDRISSGSNILLEGTILDSQQDTLPDLKPAFPTLDTPSRTNEPHTPKRKRKMISGDPGGRRIPVGLPRQKTKNMELVRPIRFVVHSAEEMKGKNWRGVHDRFQERKRTSDSMKRMGDASKESLTTKNDGGMEY